MATPAHRTGTTLVTVLAADGTPLADAEVTVEQTRHDFGFGNIGFDFVGLANGDPEDARHVFGGATPHSAAALADAWLDVFNTATLPFYWRGFEPERGHPQTDRLMATAHWLRDRGVRLKGHPLLWHTLAPEWLMPLSNDDAAEVMRARITREARDFAGVIDLWDAINEAVILPVFEAEQNAVTRLAQERGRLAVVELAFAAAREGNPSARLVLNDFDLSPDYERVIEECLAAGIQIDAIGLQTHMHQGFRGEEQIRGILDRFARFGLPLQLTEVTLVSGDLMPPEIVDLNDYQVESWPSTPEGEARQADELERMYRVAFEHPAVESITYWGIADEGSWLGAPAGLIRLDGTLKPGYEALRRLVKDEWWLSATLMRTNADGVVAVSGAAGTYRVTGEGSAVFEVARGGEGAVDVRLSR